MSIEILQNPTAIKACSETKMTNEDIRRSVGQRSEENCSEVNLFTNQLSTSKSRISGAENAGLVIRPTIEHIEIQSQQSFHNNVTPSPSNTSSQVLSPNVRCQTTSSAYSPSLFLNSLVSLAAPHSPISSSASTSRLLFNLSQSTVDQTPNPISSPYATRNDDSQTKKRPLARLPTSKQDGETKPTATKQSKIISKSSPRTEMKNVQLQVQSENIAEKLNDTDVKIHPRKRRQNLPDLSKIYDINNMIAFSTTYSSDMNFTLDSGTMRREKKIRFSDENSE